MAAVNAVYGEIEIGLHQAQLEAIQVLRGVGKSEGLDNELIASLVNTHLIRPEQRDGATWYELAHDRLLDPVRGNLTKQNKLAQWLSHLMGGRSPAPV